MNPNASSLNLGLVNLALNAHLLSLAEVSMLPIRIAPHIKVSTT